MDSTNAFSKAKLAAAIPEVWTDLYLETKDFNPGIAQNFFTDLSEYISEGGDTVFVPDIYTNTFATKTQATQGAELELQNPAQIKKTLEVDNHIYIAWLIGDKDMKQLMKSEVLNQKYVAQARKLVVKAKEQALFGLYTSLTTNVIGDGTGVIGDAELRKAQSLVENHDHDSMEAALFVTPNVYWGQLAAVALYQNRNQSGIDLVYNGNFGKTRGENKIYGRMVFSSNDIAVAAGAAKCLFALPEVFGFAGNFAAPRVQADYLLQNLAMLTVVDDVFGVGVLREDAGVLIDVDADGVPA